MAKKNRGEDITVGIGVRTAKVPRNLKQYRERAGLKQNELGQLLGHKTGAKISTWESGTQIPPLELAAELAAQLQITTSQLLGEVPPPLEGSHITNNVVNGTHHTVYQHVEGMMLLSDELATQVRAIVREEMEQGCARILEAVRAMVEAVLTPPRGEDGSREGSD